MNIIDDERLRYIRATEGRLGLWWSCKVLHKLKSIRFSKIECSKDVKQWIEVVIKKGFHEEEQDYLLSVLISLERDDYFSPAFVILFNNVIKKFNEFEKAKYFYHFSMKFNQVIGLDYNRSDAINLLNSNTLSNEDLSLLETLDFALISGQLLSTEPTLPFGLRIVTDKFC